MAVIAREEHLLADSLSGEEVEIAEACLDSPKIGEQDERFVTDDKLRDLMHECLGIYVSRCRAPRREDEVSTMALRERNKGDGRAKLPAPKLHQRSTGRARTAKPPRRGCRPKRPRRASKAKRRVTEEEWSAPAEDAFEVEELTSSATAFQDHDDTVLDGTEAPPTKRQKISDEKRRTAEAETQRRAVVAPSVPNTIGQLYPDYAYPCNNLHQQEAAYPPSGGESLGMHPLAAQMYTRAQSPHPSMINPYIGGGRVAAPSVWDAQESRLAFYDAEILKELQWQREQQQRNHDRIATLMNLRNAAPFYWNATS